MLRIHQPYIKKKKIKYFLALVSLGVFLLSSLLILNSSSESSIVYASGESRTLSEISTMQDMTQQICSNSEEGETNILKDDRGTSPISYKIIKMKDGTCWMAENLRLVNTTITSANSDVTSDFTIPASSISGFSSISDTDGYARKVYYGGDTTYGAYYNWYTATAGAGTSSVTSGDVSTSICPKGWQLPAYDGVGSFYNIINGANGFKGSWTSYNSKNGRRLGLDSENAFWPAAGHVYSGSLNHAGSYGYYWSRRANGSGNAYLLYFNSSNVYPQDSYSRYYGYPVRCVALGGLDKIEKPLFTATENGNVTVNVPSILTIDATSGMAEIADASKVIEGTATATISSNTEYTVTLHSSQPALHDITPDTTNTSEITPVSTTNPVQPGYNSWGFWDGTGNTDTKTYTLPLTTTATAFPNTTSSSITDKGNTTTHTYYVGISISPSLPSGIYATDVIITASTK